MDGVPRKTHQLQNTVKLPPMDLHSGLQGSIGLRQTAVQSYAHSEYKRNVAKIGVSGFDSGFRVSVCVCVCVCGGGLDLKRNVQSTVFQILKPNTQHTPFF